MNSRNKIGLAHFLLICCCFPFSLISDFSFWTIILCIYEVQKVDRFYFNSEVSGTYYWHFLCHEKCSTKWHQHLLWREIYGLMCSWWNIKLEISCSLAISRICPSKHCSSLKVSSSSDLHLKILSDKHN